MRTGRTWDGAPSQLSTAVPSENRHTRLITYSFPRVSCIHTSTLDASPELPQTPPRNLLDRRHLQLPRSPQVRPTSHLQLDNGNPCLSSNSEVKWDGPTVG